MEKNMAESPLEQRLAMARRCSHGGLERDRLILIRPIFQPILFFFIFWAFFNFTLKEGVVAGAKAAVVAGFATAIPTIASARMLPWARAHLNPTAQALIISTVAGAAYFIVADKTVLKSARQNSFNQHGIHTIKP